MFEDSINLIAKLPAIAAAIYRCGAGAGRGGGKGCRLAGALPAVPLGRACNRHAPCPCPAWLLLCCPAWRTLLACSHYPRPPACLLTSCFLPLSHNLLLLRRSNTYKGGDLIDADPKLDWAANLSHMMGGCGRLLQGRGDGCSRDCPRSEGVPAGPLQRFGHPPACLPTPPPCPPLQQAMTTRAAWR